MATTSMTVTAESAIRSLAADLPVALSALRRGIRRTRGGEPLFGRMSGAQAELARLVRHRPGVSVAGAAAELQLSANTVSTLVGQLCEAGVLVRESDRFDRRIARLRLTERAQAQIRRWQDHQSQRIATALRQLPPEQVRALSAAMPAMRALARTVAGESEDST